MNLLSVENLYKAYGDKQLFSGISFGIEQGQRVALVAKNGAGKSTLLKILQGGDIADSGNVMPPKSTWFEPKLRDGLVVYMINP